MKTSSPPSVSAAQRTATTVAWRTAAIYAVISCAWIFFSDHLLVAWVTDLQQVAYFAVVKGWLFVALSALLIYSLVSAQLKVRGEEEAARLRTEAELDRQRLFLADLIEHSGSLVFAKDTEGRYILVNRIWLEVTNLTREGTLGRTDHELFPGSAGEQFRQNDRAVMAAGQSQVVEELFPGPGGMRTFISVKFPTRAKSGEITGICGMTTEVTARKIAEIALRRSEDQFRTMFEMASIGMAQADPATGQFLRVNRKLCQLLGYSADELLQMRFPDLTYPEDRDMNWAMFQSAVRGEAPEYHFEKRYVRRDGRIMWSNLNVAIVRDAAGQPLHAMAAIEDITTRKESEEALQRFAEDLRVQNETLNRFNKVTVGRELRMVELKHEVNELCTRLSEPPRYQSEELGALAEKITA